MIVRRISIIGESYEVRKKAMYITDYISRTCLKKLRFYSPDFMIIVISLGKEFGEGIVLPNKCIVISIPFSGKEYELLKGEAAIRDYFIDCIKKALPKARGLYPIP